MEQREDPKNEQQHDEREGREEEQESAANQEKPGEKEAEEEMLETDNELLEKQSEEPKEIEMDDTAEAEAAADSTAENQPEETAEIEEEIEETEPEKEPEKEQHEEVREKESADGKRWYVVHTLSGQEYKVKEMLENSVTTQHLEDVIAEILIPAENVSEVKSGKKIITTRKFFPGYILVEMIFNEQTWHIVKSTPGVIGFVGSGKPVPLRNEEIADILGQIEAKKEKVKPKVIFDKGEVIKVTDGPFVNFNGVIDETYPDKGKLKVMISMFGRTTPVELEYWQVERE